MSILGKFIIISIVSINLFAGVRSMLKESNITKGDEAIFMLKGEGKVVIFPNIDEIAGFKITGKSTNRNISYQDGKKSSSYTRKYHFYPNKSITIPSYDVKIDGKVYKSKPLKLHVHKDPLDDNSTFIFLQKVDKKSVVEGEGIILSYIFKHKLSTPISDASFKSPKFDGFWVKKPKIEKNRIDSKSGYKVYKLTYILYPQRSGVLHIDEAGMDIGVISSKKRNFYSFQSIKRKVIYSNPLDINVSKLPEGVKLSGEYSFSVVLDKNKTKINEPVNLTITIHGKGNVDDIDAFKPVVHNATLYSDKPKRAMEFKDGKSIVLFKQKFAIVSDKNFTIEPMVFKYFDLKRKKVKEYRSKRFHIEVLGSTKKSTVTLRKKSISKEMIVKKEFDKGIVAFLLGLGFVSGLLVSYLLNLVGKKRVNRKKELDIKEKIKNTKDDKELLSLLLPFTNRSTKVESVIKKLEENLYYNANHKINKKDIYKNFDEFLKDEESLDFL